MGVSTLDASNIKVLGAHVQCGLGLKVATTPAKGVISSDTAALHLVNWVGSTLLLLNVYDQLKQLNVTGGELSPGLTVHWKL